jgi:hypothetical protein
MVRMAINRPEAPPHDGHRKPGRTNRRACSPEHTHDDGNDQREGATHGQTVKDRLDAHDDLLFVDMRILAEFIHLATGFHCAGRRSTSTNGLTTN